MNQADLKVRSGVPAYAVVLPPLLLLLLAAAAPADPPAALPEKPAASPVDARKMAEALANRNPLPRLAKSMEGRDPVFPQDFNWSEDARRWTERTGGSTVDLFPFILSIMHTPRYQSENIGALERDWPRIPLPANLDLFTHSATLGRRLAELLDPESDIQLAAEWSFLARLSIPAEFAESTPDRDSHNAARLAITAGWGGRGQGETVMPRRGKSPERDWTPSERSRLAALALTQSLTIDDALTLLGPRCVDVYLNGDAFWAAVPTNVWKYTLGGYQVLKKWLSYREEPLLGRPLHEDEARYFAQVVRRIAAILLLGPALDASYGAILPAASGLPGQ